MTLRGDFIFSYWIFVWYLLYISGIFPYSPKISILLAISINIIMFVLMIYYKTRGIYIFNFIFINFFIKILPYYTLIREKIYMQDLKPLVIIFISYCIWLYMNGSSVIKYQENIFNAVVYNKNKTPLMNLLTKIEYYFKHIKKI
jgi:hypothetical protein